MTAQLSLILPAFPGVDLHTVLKSIHRLFFAMSEEQPELPEQTTTTEQTPEQTPEKPVVEEIKAVADKIADVAPSVSPKDLDRHDALAGLKRVDQTILRLNKYVTIPNSITKYIY